MSSASLLEKFENQVELTAVPGSPNVQLIRTRLPQPSSPGESKMTEADWDKFEADINEAFEQLP